MLPVVSTILSFAILREVMAFRFISSTRPFGTTVAKSRGRVGCYSLLSSGHVECSPSATRIFSSPLLKTYYSNLKNTNDTPDVIRSESKSIADTPLGSSTASHLLTGLDVYEVPADDGHPLSVYGINSKDIVDSSDVIADTSTSKRRPILLLHGRTWSAIPVYHLLGGENGHADGQKSRSLMETMYSAGLQPYTMDFRGFGGTPMDGSESVIPFQCVKDVESVMDFITSRHGDSCAIDDDISSSPTNPLPALFGWSQGALVAQLTAQKRPEIISKLVLYGSIYDPMMNYPRDPLYSHNQVYARPDNGDKIDAPKIIENTFNSAIEDFTVDGSIPPEPAILFAEAALLADPHKAEWKFLSQFNTLDPARVHIPTLVIAGDQDPYAPLRIQADLFTNLGRGVDRTWSIIADADHAVHLLDGRERFVNTVKSFVENSKQGESDGCGLMNNS